MRSLKALPCTQCRKTALWPPSSANPHGEPVLSAVYLDAYKCHRCKRVTRLRPMDWHLLPYLSIEDVKRLATEYRAPEIVERLTRDWMGFGLAEREALDMTDNDLAVEDVVSLESANPAPSDGSGAEVAPVRYNGPAGTTTDSGVRSGPQMDAAVPGLPGEAAFVTKGAE